MSSDAHYKTIRLERRDGVAWITIDNPPINLFTGKMLLELDAVSTGLAADAEVRAVVLQSANDAFFIAHYDVEYILSTDVDSTSGPAGELHVFHRVVERFRTMPKATIGKIKGIARGGGSELLLSLDMRFGAIGRARLGQPEVALGIIPGGSGTQRLPRLCGRSRALEIILGCEDFDAELAERYGYINRAVPAGEIDVFVDSLALRIASFPAAAIALAKASALQAEASPVPGLLSEAYLFQRSCEVPEADERMRRFLEEGGQTHEREAAIDFDRTL